ncbi:MFS general substrate transporter [Trametes versicolor FP-101664 SS1]|uniref:MFS general substrate transporter n=1 Tax=Trametes versicolor (strain FP-101664) TaxID=717944 RepID=UPI00046241D3|nr:MFS general substrate transporter [Trametes versicolor FP-101664 SS1]EIW53164.1 MFS general substrate transporter [Trametes versicolor FP-101664 SS1]
MEEKVTTEATDIAYPVEQELSTPPTLTAEEERLLWRKIDLRLLPILIIMYLVASIDRSNIGNAKLQGLLTQLNLTGDQYNVALVMTRVWNRSLLLKKLRPSRWLPGITLAWGIIATLMGLVKTYPQLVGVRVCLGIAEAGLPPGVFYYITMWYPRHMVQYRVGLFWGGATFAGAFSGLLAFAISFMSGTAGLLGWSWIFIIEGLITIVVAFAAFFILVDFPDTAMFLTPEERAYVVHRKSILALAEYDNSSVGEEEHFEMRQLWETLFNWKVILCCLINASVITPVYGITLFLPFGFNTVISQLLSVPPYIVGTAAVVAWSKWSDIHQKRSPSILAGLLFCLVGFAINAADTPIGVRYFGTFLVVTGGYAGFPGNVSWMGNNTVGHYRRAIAIGMQVMFANAGGAIASNIYRVQDAPHYLLGHAVELGFVGMGLTLLPIMVFTYMRANAQRDAAQRDMEARGVKIEYSTEELRKMGNQAPDFRFTL